MKRMVQLHGLSSEHHHALAMIRRIRRCMSEGESEVVLGMEVTQRFTDELEPHFLIEEELILPALESTDSSSLSEQARTEHRLLRTLIGMVRIGRLDALRAFADFLEAHVQFEERELYPAFEAIASPAVLSAIALRSPKPILG